MRRILSALSSLLLIVGCGGGSSSPSSTPTTPSPTVTSLAVTGVVTSGRLQCTATATFSNGTTQDVTSTATWTTSDSTIATVSASGLVTGRKAGEVEVRATYQGVTGTLRVRVTEPEQPPTTYTLSGTVTDSGTNRAISGATVAVVDGTDAGKSATTDSAGTYRITSVSAGTFRLRATASGYTASEKAITVAGDTQTNFPLTPTTPTCSVPSAPTAPNASVSGTTVAFSWTAPTGTVTDYLLEIGTSSGTANVDTKTVSGTSYTWTGVSAGTYYSRVKARNSCGTGTASNEVRFTVSPPSTYPGTLPTPTVVNGRPTCSASLFPSIVSCVNDTTGAPTALCKDSRYSCSLNASGTCSSNGGVQCWVCPGTLCSSQIAPASFSADSESCHDEGLFVIGENR